MLILYLFQFLQKDSLQILSVNFVGFMICRVTFA